MKVDGKSAKGGSDQDDKEDFGEASGRSNGGLRKNIREPFLKRDNFGRRRDRRIDRRKTYSVVRG